MKAKLIAALVQALLTLLTPDMLRVFADKLLDFAENFVIGTDPKLDDKLVLPICLAIREAFNVPDNDEDA